MFDDDEDAALDALLGDSEPEVAPPPKAAKAEEKPADTPADDGLFPEHKPKVEDFVSPKKKQLAKELWERLAKSRPGPDNKDLMFLARFVPLMSTPAAKTLLTKNLTLDELKELIQYVPKAKEAATKLALKMGAELEEDDIRFIFTQTKSAEVGKYLLKRFPNDANLGLVERTIDDLTDFVAEVRNREPTKTVLREIDRKL